MIEGACSGADKLAMLPSLARAYREQADREAPRPPPPARAARSVMIDCATERCSEIVRVPKRGGAAVVLRTAPLVGHLAVDRDHVYWSEGPEAAWQMMRQPKRKGRAEPIAHGDHTGPMVRGRDGFYTTVFDHGSEDLVALRDGAATSLIAKDVSGSFTFDTDRVFYFASKTFTPERSDSLLSVSLAGGDVRTHAVGQFGGALRVADGQIYWASHNVPPFTGSQIMRTPVAGGIVRVIVEARPEVAPEAFAVDARSLYWVQQTLDGSSVFRAPRDGGIPTLLGVATKAEGRFDWAARIEVDDTYVYWNAQGVVAPDRRIITMLGARSRLLK